MNKIIKRKPLPLHPLQPKSATPVVMGGDLKALGITDPENQYLGRKEAARFIGQKVQTLAAWACSNRYNLPYRKVGRQALYKVSDLLAFLEGGNHA